MRLSVLVFFIVAVGGISAHYGNLNKHPCDRRCSKNDKRTCVYNWTIHYWRAFGLDCGECPKNTRDCFNFGCLTTNGVRRTVTVANGQLPGPAIIACENDIIVVNLKGGLLESDAYTIHWHGMHMKDTPYMDGVPFITQCPVYGSGKFQYRFRAYPAGTHFWHSHTGLQRADGLAGAMIIRKADDVLKKFYDVDSSKHFLLIQDWFKGSAFEAYSREHIEFFDLGPGSGNIASRDQPVTKTSAAARSRRRKRSAEVQHHKHTILINGRNTGEKRNMPIPVFKVKRNKRHRFRIIGNGIQTCPFDIYVEKHSMTVIASDGHPLKPLHTDRVLVQSGERFDVVINTDQPVGNYWVQIRSYMDCENTYGYAILSYEGAKASAFTPAPSQPIPMKPGSRLFNVLGGSNSTRRIFFSQAETLIPQEETYVDMRRYIPFGFSVINNMTIDHPYTRPIHIRTVNNLQLLPQIWDRTFHSGPSPVLTQLDEIPKKYICDQPSKTPCPTNKLCRCAMRIVVPQNSVVDFVLFDHAKYVELNHPFHLHGYYFQVLESGVFGKTISIKDVKARLSTERLNKLSRTAPFKDTVGVPARGYVVLRVYTNNPGPWFFHCHVDFHAENGMSFILQVGSPDEWVHPPSSKFPKCGKYP